MDAFGDQAGVGPLDGVVEVRRDDQPLAARLIVGPQLLTQDRVGHVVLEIGTAEVLQLPELKLTPRRPPHWRRSPRTGPQLAAKLDHRRRVGPVASPILVVDGRIRHRQDPLRRALKQPQLADRCRPARRPSARPTSRCRSPRSECRQTAHRGPSARCEKPGPRTGRAPRCRGSVGDEARPWPR